MKKVKKNIVFSIAFKWKDLKIKINLKHHYDKQMYYITAIIKAKNMIEYASNCK